MGERGHAAALDADEVEMFRRAEESHMAKCSRAPSGAECGYGKSA